MKIAAITSGKNTPSTRFRIRQYIPHLYKNNIEVIEYYPWLDKTAGLPSAITDISPEASLQFLEFAWRQLKLSARITGIFKSWKYDLTWLGRELLPGNYSLESLLHHPLAFDVDDAIWLAKPNGHYTISKIAKQSELILAGNDYIADWMSQFNKKIHIIPTAIDTFKFQKKTYNFTDYEQKPFTIGWTGSAGNYNYLYSIEKALHQFISKHKANLLVIAERPPSFKLIDPQHVEFIKWSPETEALSILKMDIGLMPLPDNEWTRGKCAFKMLQYMACGIPVIVSPVGMNKDILNMAEVGFGADSNEEFYESLLYLYENPDIKIKLGINGRNLVEKKFSTSIIAGKLHTIFTSL